MSENKIEFLCNVKTAMEAEQIVLLLEKKWDNSQLKKRINVHLRWE